MTNSVIDSIVAGLTPLEQSEAYLAQFGEDTVENRQYGTPDQRYNVQDIEAAAEAIRATGESLQDGAKVYDTGNTQLNEALYGADISNNISGHGQELGFRTPRQYDPNYAAELGKAVIQSTVQAGLGGVAGNLLGGLLGTGAAAGGGGAQAASYPSLDPSMILNFDSGQPNLPQNTEFVDPDSQTELTGMGDIQGPGGLFDLSVLDFPNAPELVQPPVTDQPQQVQGGGGGSSNASDTPISDAIFGDLLGGTNNNTTGNELSEFEAERELPMMSDLNWKYMGNGAFRNINTGERRFEPAEGAVEGELYSLGDGVPGADPGQQNRRQEVVDQAGGSWKYMGNGAYRNVLTRERVFGTDAGRNVGEIYGSPNTTPAPNPPSTTSGGYTWTDQYNDRYTTTDNTGGTGGGTGTGTGTGTGSGDGTGDGSGNGSGNGVGTGGGFQGGGTESGDLFGYSLIAPSRPATLGPMTDHVGLLQGLLK